jgi:hypothetical protein
VIKDRLKCYNAVLSTYVTSLCWLPTYLTPCIRSLIEELPVDQLVKKVSTFMPLESFITLTTALNVLLLWARLIQSTPSHLISLIYTLILSFHLYEGFLSSFFYIWVSVHHEPIIYNKPTRCNSGSIVFIKNYRYALHVLAVTVYSAPDDGRKGRPKHVEHICSC